MVLFMWRKRLKTFLHSFCCYERTRALKEHLEFKIWPFGLHGCLTGTTTCALHMSKVGKWGAIKCKFKIPSLGSISILKTLWMSATFYNWKVFKIVPLSALMNDLKHNRWDIIKPFKLITQKGTSNWPKRSVWIKMQTSDMVLAIRQWKNQTITSILAKINTSGITDQKMYS